MTRRCLTILICSLLLSVTTASLAVAQDNGRMSQRARTGHVIDLEFPGGTAAEYVAALQSASDSVNIVVLNDITSVKMPSIVLRQVAIRSAVALMEDVPDNDYAPTMTLSVDHLPAPGVGGNDVYSVRAKQNVRRSGSPLRTTVISVRELLDGGVEVEALLTAVETALTQLQDHMAAADVKFHEATGLLICRGHAEQTNAIEQVISQLESDHIRRMNMVRNQQNVEDLTARLHEFELEMKGLREMLSATEQRRRELEAIIESKSHQIELHQKDNMELRARVRELGG